MTTVIRTICPSWGEVELTIEDIRLELADDTAEGRYSFDCPGCGERHRRPASSRVVTVLRAAGVATRIVVAGPITEQEVNEFVAALDRDGWFDDVAAPD